VYNKHYVIKFVCDLWQVGDQGEVYNKHYGHKSQTIFIT
jgi:hypothetical protein